MRRTPALIVGGGPAGLATAIMLAKSGAEHLLIERDRQTGDALCGGFLSWRTLAALERLGIAPDTLNKNRIRRVRLIHGTHMATAPLPRPAAAVSRHRLDSVMAAHARALGASIETGVAARQAEDCTVRTADGATLSGDALFLATGKHDLRGLARPAEAKGEDPVLGLRIRLGPAPKLTTLIGDTIELHLFDRGYAGVAIQEDGSVNCCMAVHRSRLDEAGSPQRLLALLGTQSPHLGERLAFATTDATIDAIANVPYGWRQKNGMSGLYRLGDQAAVIPSLAGEGIGIAIESGTRAAATYLAHGPQGAADYQRTLDRDLTTPFRVAALIRDAAERPATASAMIVVARLAPALVGLAARLTRIDHSPLDARHAARES